MTQADDARGDALTAALVEELSKKTGVCWLGYSGREQAVWHVWYADALYVVSGGNEQPLPDIEEADRVEVVMRSRENGGRLVTWVGETSRVLPTDPLWEPVAAALVGSRLNLDDLGGAADRWSRESVVTRVVPTGEVVERPGSLSDDAHVAEPKPTAATTRRGLPAVLHRRVRRRPRLS